MSKNNARLKWTIIGVCLTAFMVLVGLGSSFVTSKVNNAKVEQKVEDNLQSRTFRIEKLEVDVDEIKRNTSFMKQTAGRHDERIKSLEKGFDKINDKLDRIWERVK